MTRKRIGFLGLVFLAATSPLWVPAAAVAALQDRFRRRPGSW